MEDNISKRGKVLTIYLVIMISIAVVSLFYSYDTTITKYEDLKNVPRWLFALGKLFSLLLILFYIAIWKMKKWGVMGTLILITVSALLTFFHFPQHYFITQFIGVVLFGLVTWRPYKFMK